MNNRWHVLLQSNKFIYSGLGVDYSALRVEKNAYLVGDDNRNIKGILDTWYELSRKTK